MNGSITIITFFLLFLSSLCQRGEATIISQSPGPVVVFLLLLFLTRLAGLVVLCSFVSFFHFFFFTVAAATAPPHAAHGGEGLAGLALGSCNPPRQPHTDTTTVSYGS